MGMGRRIVTWGMRETFTIEGLDAWTQDEKREMWWNNKEYGSFVAAELRRRRETGVVSNRALNPESKVWFERNPIPLSEKDRRWWEADDESNSASWGFWEGMFGPSENEEVGAAVDPRFSTGNVAQRSTDSEGAHTKRSDPIEPTAELGFFGSIFGIFETPGHTHTNRSTF